MKKNKQQDMNISLHPTEQTVDIWNNFNKNVEGKLLIEKSMTIKPDGTIIRQFENEVYQILFLNGEIHTINTDKTCLMVNRDGKRFVKQNDKYFEFLCPRIRNDKKITIEAIIYSNKNKLIRKIYKYNYKILEYADEIGDLDHWKKLLNEDLLILNFLPIRIYNQLIKEL
jgi:hypothetical protein